MLNSPAYLSLVALRAVLIEIARVYNRSEFQLTLPPYVPRWPQG